MYKESDVSVLLQNQVFRPKVQNQTFRNQRRDLRRKVTTRVLETTWRSTRITGCSTRRSTCRRFRSRSTTPTASSPPPTSNSGGSSGKNRCVMDAYRGFRNIKIKTNVLSTYLFKFLWIYKINFYDIIYYFVFQIPSSRPRFHRWSRLPAHSGVPSILLQRGNQSQPPPPYPSAKWIKVG